MIYGLFESCTTNLEITASIPEDKSSETSKNLARVGGVVRSKIITSWILLNEESV